MGKGQDDDCAQRAPLLLSEAAGLDPSRRRPRGYWNESSAEAELRAAVEQIGHWPSHQGLKDAGFRVLAGNMVRFASHNQWARRLGYEPNPRHGRRRWTEPAIEEALRALLTGREDWLTINELISSGNSDLLGAMGRNGGNAHWARRMGYEPNPSSVPGAWNDERIERELSQLIDRVGGWPRPEHFFTNDLGELYAAVGRHGGMVDWRQRLGAPAQAAAERVAHEPYGAWSDERIERELAAVVAGRLSFPTQAEFKAAGKDRLLRAIQRHGGTAAWADRFGLAGPDPGPRTVRAA